MKTIEQVKEYLTNELSYSLADALHRKNTRDVAIIRIYGKCYKELLDFIDSEETSENPQS
jgi:hypothetical protein